MRGKTSTKRVFQSIVIGSMALHLVWFFMPYAWMDLYSDKELDLLGWSSHGAYIDINGPVADLFLIAYLTASIGLVLLKRWARVLFLALTIVSIALTLAGGFYVSPPLDSTISYLVSLADGAILAMAYSMNPDPCPTEPGNEAMESPSSAPRGWS